MRYALRQFQRSPVFFAAAALLIALGIAATTGIFTLVNALLLRPLPIRNPQNVVQLFQVQAKRPANPFFDYPFYKRLAEHSSTLFNIVGQIETTRSLENGSRAERIFVAGVTQNYFNDLGVSPAAGRVLGRADDHAAVLSYGYWSRGFARDPNIIGQTVRLQGHPYSIVGVTAQGFTGTTLDSSPDVWIAFANQLDFARSPNPNLDQFVIQIVARLKPGLAQQQAQQETAALWNRYMDEIAAQDSTEFRGLARGKLEVRSITHGLSPLRDTAKTSLVLLLAVTGLLLLMVCANVGGLLLSRATARERESAIQIALGASRWRMVRQWLIESLLLTGAGGACGILISYASLPLIESWIPPARGTGIDPAEIRALALELHLDFRVAAFSLVLTLLTTVFCALAPAWRTVRSDLNLALKSVMSERRQQVLQSTLCSVQIAICAMLLLAAGLILHSLENLRAVNPGFDAGRVAIFSIDPHVRAYDRQRTWALQQRLLNEVRRWPGVEGAAIADRALMRGIGLGGSVVLPGESGAGVTNTSMNSVSPDYFEVLGIRLLDGRKFRASDASEEGKINPVIVNEAFVRKFFSGRNALGQQFATGQRFEKPEYEIVGVVNDTEYRSLREIPPPIFYLCGFGPKQYPDAFKLHVRTQGDPRALIQPIRGLLKSIDPEVPLYQAGTLSEEVDQSLWQERVLVSLTTCFGAFALLLSAAGLYGILAYFVARRRREIGLRMALGASARRVTLLVGQRIIPLLAMGIAAGAALSWLLSSLMRSILYGVQPFDPWAASITMLLLAVTGMAAAALPVLRAVRVDPAVALRQD
jgi:predicted permease